MQISIANSLTQPTNPKGWTPSSLASLGAYWWRADLGMALRQAGPDWPSQGSHARGLSFDGSTNYVDLGNSPLYDDTAIAASYTFLVYVTTTAGCIYSEGSSASATRFFQIVTKVGGTNAQVTLRDDSGTDTIDASSINNVFTPNAWHVVSIVLDEAGTGWGFVVNGVEEVALGTAYTNSPATTTFNRATIGALGRNTYASHYANPIAYGMRHAAALTLTQCQQVHEYIAAAVAGDGISLTIAGSQSASANSPENEWAMSENTAGDEVADSAGSVTGARQPGDRVDGWTDQLQGAVLDIADTYQPKIVTDVWNGNLQTVRFANNPPTALDWTSPPTLSGAVTHLMIVDFQGPFSGNKYVLDSTTTGTNVGHGWGWVGPVSGSGISAFRRSSFAVTNWTTSAAINQQRAVVLIVGGTGTPDNKAYLNGGSDLLTSTYTDSLGSTVVRIGSFNSGNPLTNFSADMDLLEWVVVPSELDADTINQWLAYAENITGLSYTEVS